MIYPQPTPEAIESEFSRLKPKYEAFMAEQGEAPDDAQLREWAAENLREHIILEHEAKAAGKTVAALMRDIAAAVPEVTVDEARSFFKAHPERFVAPERVHAQHIVLHRDYYDAAAAMAELLNLRAGLLKGELSWEVAVATYSSCADNSDLGFFPRGVMVASFEEAAFALEEGALSDVVETPFGWHLIRVVSHLPEEPMLFEEAKPRLMASLREEREHAALERFVDERKDGFAQTEGEEA